MVKHIVLWNLIPELSENERKEAALKVKDLLEPIKDLVEGALEMQVIFNEFDSSNRDIALISTFDTVEALQSYQSHPAHVEAGKYIRSVTCDRACMDYK